MYRFQLQPFNFNDTNQLLYLNIKYFASTFGIITFIYVKRSEILVHSRLFYFVEMLTRKPNR